MTAAPGSAADLQPPIRFSSVRWRDALKPWWPEDAPCDDLIERADLFRAATEWRCGSRPVTDLFVLTMAWGYGNVGYGRYRTRRMLVATDDVAGRLQRALAPLQGPALATPDQIAAAYRSLGWGGTSRIRGLGPAFFTKLMYAAGHRHDQVGLQPLILDARVARALPAAGGPALGSWGWTAKQWLSYLTWAHEQAALLGVPADVIEYRLFSTGRLP
ncbi:8-oxoguanine DNA glycosylase OGG fold protein [Geodermatophilus nigrescens]